MSAIEIKNLTKTFHTSDGEVCALKNVNISIESGDIYGIIGMFTPILVALLKKFYEWGYFDFLKKRKSPPKPLDE